MTPAAGGTLAAAPSGSYTVDVDLFPVAGATVNVPNTLVTLTQSAATATSSSFTISVGGHLIASPSPASPVSRHGDMTITIGAGWTTGATATSKTVTVVDGTHPIAAARAERRDAPADGAVIAVPDATFTATIDLLVPTGTPTHRGRRRLPQAGRGDEFTASGMTKCGIALHVHVHRSLNFSAIHAGSAQLLVGGTWAANCEPHARRSDPTQQAAGGHAA